MTVTPLPDNLPESGKVWTTLITNTKYLSGLITLDYALKRVGSKYPLVALYTDTFEQDGHIALDSRGIYKKRIQYLLPKVHKDYAKDARFYDCWSKLQPFSLFEFERVVQLDSDMVVVRNMDELFDDLELNDHDRIFAASHACVCNPYNKAHYPKDWVKENCAYTNYNEHVAKLTATNDASKTPSHILGPSSDVGLGICNGGLQVVQPNRQHYQKILDALDSPNMTGNYDFADQSLLSDVFEGKWVALSYKYNALKTLKIFHSDIWSDETVKNVHYIITPKPWDVRQLTDRNSHDDTDTFGFWFEVDDDRLKDEKDKGLIDGF